MSVEKEPLLHPLICNRAPMRLCSMEESSGRTRLGAYSHAKQEQTGGIASGAAQRASPPSLRSRGAGERSPAVSDADAQGAVASSCDASAGASRRASDGGERRANVSRRALHPQTPNPKPRACGAACDVSLPRFRASQNRRPDHSDGYRAGSSDGSSQPVAARGRRVRVERARRNDRQ